MKDFINEVKRRNVAKVGVAYLAFGWIVIQVTDVAVPALNLPESLNSIVVYLGLIGFPFAIFLAWAYELTPEGVKRTEDVEQSESITQQTSQKINLVIIGCLVVIVIGLLVERFSKTTPVEITETGTPSIAVLAFADFSPSQDQGYFADGISDEILNLLVKTNGMTVTGRTSSFAFKGKDADIPKIAESLNVDHVLEGSISKSGNRIKVTAQLNDANGIHIWSETYIRELTDIFDIQEEIAQEITDRLATSVGLDIKSLQVNRTENIAAYEDYIRGRDLLVKRGYDNIQQATLLFQMTLAEDPNYAPAWRDLATVYSILESYAPDASKEELVLWRTVGTALIKRAISLNPDDALSYAVKSAFSMYASDYPASINELVKAINLSPNNSDVLDLAAQSFLEIGYFRRAEDLAKKAVMLDPLAPIYRVTLSRAYYDQDKIELGLEQSRNAIMLNDGLTFPYHQMIGEAIIKRDFDTARATQLLASRNQTEIDINAQELTQIVSFITNYQAGDSIPNNLHPYFRWRTAVAVNDVEVIRQMYEEIWEDDVRTNSLLFERAGVAMNTPRWKEEVRKLGIFDVWRKHGFPAHCRQIQSDDFECDSQITVAKVSVQ